MLLLVAPKFATVSISSIYFEIGIFYRRNTLLDCLPTFHLLLYHEVARLKQFAALTEIQDSDSRITYLLYSFILIVRDFGRFFNCLLFLYDILLCGVFANFLDLYRHRIRNLYFFARSGTAASCREAVALNKNI